MDFAKHCQVRLGSRVKLSGWDPADTAGLEKNHKTKNRTSEIIARLDEIQYLLYAERKHSLLIVLQALDTGGKDGTIRHVMSGINPQGCRVTGFKVPTPEEKAHDFLWRIHKAAPRLGEIGIFNRSQYEDVLAARVHKLVPENVWRARYQQINQFEEYLVENGTTILKFFLHISRKEQRKRLEDRIKDRAKCWKLSPDDFKERLYWPEYQRAYEDALSKCNTKRAPWFIIPSNHRWFRNLAVSSIIVQTLESLKMKYPKPSFDVMKFKLR